MTPHTATPPPRPSPLARFGPLAVIVAALALIAVIASTGRQGESDQQVASKAGSANRKIPITYAAAKKDGTVGDQRWGDDCDPKTGNIEVPSFYAPPCVVARKGIKGGDTYQGVTKDAIKVVLYEAPDDDISASLQAKLDPADKQRETARNDIKMLEDLYETWGRRIEFVFMKGSGSTETQARADAVKVATEIGAFASIGGPGQQGAYADELSRRKVLCIGCGLAVPDETFQKNAPYMWGTSQPPEQWLLNVGDYLVDRLNKRKASFAGDPAFRKRQRSFGVVHFEQDPPVFGRVSAEATKKGEARGFKYKTKITYQLVLSELGEKARTIVARLKREKITTVVFMGDPIMPIYLTKAAADQDYHPEWVITGTVLTDTATLGRMYDQDQWGHAFGLSPLGVAVPRDQREGHRLYKWYYGKAPAAVKTSEVLWPTIELFMRGVHLAGPDLTPETFRDGLFAAPSQGGEATAARRSFGKHGVFPDPDYNGTDDMQEIWWDSKAKGKDEQDVEGSGMVRYVDGGKRYLPGQMPKGPPGAFRKDRSILGYQDVPKDLQPPSYPSPKRKGG